ncbi:MAG: hypothetical protein ACI35W_07430, partial [Anaeroplasmataceae bacterium]
MKRKISSIFIVLIFLLFISSCKKDVDTTRYTDIYLDEHPEHITITAGETDGFRIHTGKYNYMTWRGDPIYIKCDTDDYETVCFLDLTALYALKANTSYTQNLKPKTNIVQGKKYDFTIVYRPTNINKYDMGETFVWSGAYDDDIWMDKWSDFKYTFLPGLTKMYVKFICHSYSDTNGEIWDKDLEKQEFEFLKNGLMKVEVNDHRLEIVDSELSDDRYYFYDGKAKEIIVNNKGTEEIKSSIGFISQKHDLEINTDELTFNVDESKYVRFTESGWYKISGSGFDFTVDMSRSLFSREREKNSDPNYIFIDVCSDNEVGNHFGFLSDAGADRYILIKSDKNQEITITKESDERMAPFVVRYWSSTEDVSLDDGVEYKFYMPKGHKIIRQS